MKKRIIFKINDNKLYNNISCCEDEFNVELYEYDFDKGNVEKKGFIYNLNEEEIYIMGEFLRLKYEMGVEIIWNEVTSEIFM